jgi:hypothetical protein
VLRASTRSKPRSRRAKASQVYLLKGLLCCGLCDRRMQGQPNHGHAYYRCRFPNEYALANKVKHPKTVYVREDQITPKLDAWLAEMLSPKNIDRTLDSIIDARLDADRDAEARQVHVATGRWIAEVEAERSRIMQSESPAAPAITKESLRAIVPNSLAALQRLDQADPSLKAQLYAELGLRLEYRPDEATVRVEVPFAVCNRSCRRGDSHHNPTRPRRRSVRHRRVTAPSCGGLQ